MPKKLANLLAVTAIAVLVPSLAASITNAFHRPIQAVDPNGYFLWISVHHVLQGLLSVLLLKLIFRDRTLGQLGFNVQNRTMGFGILRRFLVIWTLLMVGFFGVFGALDTGFGPYISSLYPVKPEVILSKYIVELLLIIALGEEPLFRALVTQVLEITWKKKIVVGKREVPVVFFFSAVLFSLAHINYELFPFRIVQIDPAKLLLNLIFGFFLAFLFDKTRSLFYTTIAHAYSNVLIYTLGFGTAFLMK